MCITLADLAAIIGAFGSVAAAWMAWKVADLTAKQGRDMRADAERAALRLARERTTLAAESLAGQTNVAASLISDVLTKASLWFMARDSSGSSRFGQVEDQCTGHRRTVDLIAEVAHRFLKLSAAEREALTVEQLDQLRIDIESQRSRLAVILDSMSRRLLDFASTPDRGFPSEAKPQPQTPV